MTNFPIYNPIERALWGVSISILFLITIYFIVLAQKKEKSEEKKIFLGISFTFLGIAFMRIFFFISDLYVPGNFIGTTFYGTYNTNNQTYLMLVKMAHISYIIGITFMYFFAESLLKRMRYLLILINFVLIFLILFLPIDLAINVEYVAIFLNVTMLAFMLFIFAKRSRAEYQAISMIMVFGLLLVIIGQGFDSKVVKELEITPIELAPIFYIIGSLVFIAPTRISPQYFRRSILYWTMISGYFISTFVWFISIAITKHLPFEFLLMLLGFETMLLLFTSYSIYQIVKLAKHQQSHELDKDAPDILAMFVKSQKLTEEEVSISKEKKICVVCKGNILGMNFICRGCEIFYCQKCYNALVNLENACWACDMALDESKPVKPFRKEGEQEVIGEEVIPKKGRDSEKFRKK